MYEIVLSFDEMAIKCFSRLLLLVVNLAWVS